jgi:predicted permease
MRFFRAFALRFRGLFASSREDDFSAELESHVALDTEAGVRSGLDPQEARRQALIRLGGAEQTRQAHRDRRTLPWIEDLLHDARFGLRMMARNPGFTAVAVLTLAIGIGVTTTAFTWINAVLLQPLGGVADPGRLVTVETVTSNGEWVPNSYPDFIDFRDRLKLIDGIAAARIAAFSVGQQDHAERVWGELVSGNFFAVLGVQPEAGRLFLPAEFADSPGKFPIVVISDRYWRSHYAADPSIIGKTIRINQHDLTVVGVAAPAFHGSIPVTAFDLFIPYMEQPMLNGVQEWMLRDRHNRNMLGIARIKRGVPFNQAQQELKTLADHMAIANSDVSLGMSATLMPLWKSPHGPQGLLIGPLRILMGVCVLVLLIVCANVANLLLARATVREKEFSARLALGAGRYRLVRQVLTESLLLTGSGAALGLALTPWMGHALGLFIPPGPTQQLAAMDTRPDLAVLAFTAGICVFAALAAGLVPALQVSRLNLSARLNAGGRTGVASRGRNRLRSTLVASEVALALVALVGAGLFARGFQQTMKIDPGFDPDHVLLNQFYLTANGYNLLQRKEFCRKLEERMLAAPGVTDVAYSDGVPLGFEPSWWEELKIDGYTPQPNENMNIFRNVVSPGYLPLMHIPVLDGRNFADADNETQQVGAMIVNQAFVRRFFHGRNPIGARIHGWGRWFRVVGVAKDSKYHYLGESTPAYFYVPFRQIYREDMNLAFYVRTKGNPDSVLNTLRTQVSELDPNVTVFDAAPLNQFIGASLYPQKVAASLMAVLGSIALLLAAVGLYGVMAYSVAQRTQEIGVRMALGARPVHVLSMVLRQGMALTLLGLVAGAALSVALARAVASVTFTNSGMGSSAKLVGSGVNGPIIYLAAAAFLGMIAALASYIPARRAAAIVPMEALRTE